MTQPVIPAPLLLAAAAWVKPLLFACGQDLLDPGENCLPFLARRALAMAQGELAVYQCAVGGHLERPSAALRRRRGDGNAALELVINCDL